MNRLTITFVAMLSLLLATGCPLSKKAAPFNAVGHWKVSDGSGQQYYITVNEDRSADSTLPHHGQGYWSVEDHNIRITWQNRWIDYLVVTETGVSRVGCAPGTTLNDIPENSSTAVRVESVPLS